MKDCILQLQFACLYTLNSQGMAVHILVQQDEYEEGRRAPEC